MLKNNLIKKFLSFSIGGYVNALIGLLTVPIVTRMLSPEQYGIASLISIIVEMLVVFCSLALDQSFVRFFYEVEEDFCCSPRRLCDVRSDSSDAAGGGRRTLHLHEQGGRL